MKIQSIRKCWGAVQAVIYQQAYKTILSVILISSVGASTAHATACPMPNPRYFELLSGLDHFVQSIKKGPECQSLSQELTDLKVLYSASDRTLVEKAAGVVDSSQKIELTVDELKKLSNYSADVTKKIGAIVGSLSEKSDCLESKKASTLYTLSAITHEVSSFAAAFSGPYGVLVQTGGAIISGILRGIDSIISSFKDPYDFSKSEDRILFVTNLCTLHKIREEVDNLIEPEYLIKTYRELQQHLVTKKEKLLTAHPVARTYDELYTLWQKTKLKAEGLAKKVQAIELDTKSSPWDRCISVAELIYNRKSSEVEDLVNVLESVPVKPYACQRELSPRALLELARGPQGMPAPSACLTITKKRDLDFRVGWGLSVLREMGISYQETFRGGFKELFELGKADDPVYGYNPIHYLESTYEKLSWTDVQLPKILQLQGPNSYSIRREIIERRDYLDDRFFSQLAPRFLEWYQDDVQAQLSKFTKASEKARKEIAKDFLAPREAQYSVDWKSLITNLKKIDDKTVHSVSYFRISNFVVGIEKMVTSVGVIIAYCDYLTSQGTLSPKLRGMCEERNFAELGKQITQTLQGIGDTLEDYAEWCYQKDYVSRSDSEAMLQKIRDCHKTIGIPLKNQPNPQPHPPHP